MKIALIIPCTSKGRPWKTMKDTYLYNLTFKTFLTHQDKEHQYVFYLGIDHDDPIFNKISEQIHILKFKLVFPNIDIKFIVLNEKKGYLTKMWNKLYQIAYNEKCDYFYQCGDDIEFCSSGWINDSIRVLQQHHNIGLTGPINNNNFILTQAFVSRLHMDIFGFFFPENIINWGCDDWYNHVYKPNHFFPLNTHYCKNMGGKPRYEVNDNPTFWNDYKPNVEKIRNDTLIQANIDKQIIVDFIQKYDLL